MLHCTVKFCGGLQTRATIAANATALCVPPFRTPPHSPSRRRARITTCCLSSAGAPGCPYLYEEIEADRRVVITSRDDMQSAIDEIRAAASHSAG